MAEKVETALFQSLVGSDESLPIKSEDEGGTCSGGCPGQEEELEVCLR